MDLLASTTTVQGDTSDRQLQTFNTAATADIVNPPASGDKRNVKQMTIRNRHASTSCDVTVNYDANGTLYELIKVTLVAGQTLEYQEGVGFFVISNADKLDVKLRTTADVINATTSWADITGLTYPVESGKHYGFECFMQHIENAATTGARFGINGPTMTAMRIAGYSIFTGSITAATWASDIAVGGITARDTTVLGSTTSSVATPAIVPAYLSGWFNPSAAGTFAVRSQSEVAVAAGVTIKQGAWCRLWEFDN
jgi:hypothetical protein